MQWQTPIFKWSNYYLGLSSKFHCTIILTQIKYVQSLQTMTFIVPSETTFSMCNKTVRLLTCNKRLQSACDRLPFSNRLINVIKKLGFWIRRIQIGGLTCIHYRPTTDCDKRVKLASLGKVSSFLQTVNIWRFRQLHSWSSLTIGN